MTTSPEKITNEKTTAEVSTEAQEMTSLLRGNRDLAILYAIAGQLNRKVDVHEALQEVLAQVTKLLGLQTGWVWLLDERGKSYLAAAQSLPPYLADHPERMTGSCLCLDTFCAGGMEGAANINVLRCSRLKNAERDKDPTSLGLRFHASVPIHAGETPIGVLNVASEDWRELEEEKLQLLHIIGDQIGLAIQRARLSAQHTRAAQRLATIEERNRLAREIHDTVAQGLAAISLQLEIADALATTRPERAQEAIRRAMVLARQNLEETRRSMIDLRAASLQNRTLPEALAALASETKADGVEIVYSCEPEGNFPILPPRIETSLYRIAQEALSNALRHAQAHSIALTLEADDGDICLVVQDDGQGFNPDEVTQAQHAPGSQGGHFGLTGMNERVRLLGGVLCISSEPGKGTCITACVPLEEG
ncbi:MAG TPA: GAF domain-containing sensor histidine kinase [Ktedonobacteraceae bacterium]|jgi:two-component system NarL family sensor kinase|nr:GAF domain-containing sensor histidine kinase [Ktedonobacteraceae bacterium]